VVLGVALAQGGLAPVRDQLGTAQPEWLALAVGLAMAVELVKTLRWRVLLGPAAGSFWPLASVLFSARLMNALLPLRAGDVWRVASAAGQEGQTLPRAGGALLVEKLLDGTGLVLLGTGLLTQITALRAPLEGQLSAQLLVVAALGIGLGLATALWRWQVRRRGLLLPRVGRTTAAAAGALTFASLGLGVLVNLAVLQALGLGPDLTLGLVILLSGYALGLAPAGPGQLGVFELGITAPLVALGVPSGPALAVAVALHLVLLSAFGLGTLVGMASRVPDVGIRP
jgi:uncharacterized membrane protein YbhN (UPF0104 family)